METLVNVSSVASVDSSDSIPSDLGQLIQSMAKLDGDTWESFVKTVNKARRKLGNVPAAEDSVSPHVRKVLNLDGEGIDRIAVTLNSGRVMILHCVPGTRVSGRGANGFTTLTVKDLASGETYNLSTKGDNEFPAWCTEIASVQSIRRVVK